MTTNSSHINSIIGIRRSPFDFSNWSNLFIQTAGFIVLVMPCVIDILCTIAFFIGQPNTITQCIITVIFTMSFSILSMGHSPCCIVSKLGTSIDQRISYRRHCANEFIHGWRTIYCNIIGTIGDGIGHLPQRIVPCFHDIALGIHPKASTIRCIINGLCHTIGTVTGVGRRMGLHKRSRIDCGG